MAQKLELVIKAIVSERIVPDNPNSNIERKYKMFITVLGVDCMICVRVCNEISILAKALYTIIDIPFYEGIKHNDIPVDMYKRLEQNFLTK